MNYSDSTDIRELMCNHGYTETKDEKKAAIIILTSCSIRQQAEDKILGWGIKARKKTYQNKTFILTGCMAIRYNRKADKPKKEYTKKLKKKMPWLDIIIPITEIEKIPNLVSSHTKKKSVNKSINSKQGLVPISTGCNNFCSYCIVPYTRGPLKNYSVKKILEKIDKSLSQGHRLITLLGQNVNSWENKYKGKKRDFAGLLKIILKNFPQKYWINFLSSNPHKWNQDLTNIITQEEKIMKWANIAIQSGSNKILKKMNRKYKVNDFIKIVKDIRNNYPQFNISTDIIVGFPGETKKDFQKTLSLIEKLKFNMVYVGKYSPRKGTYSDKNFQDKLSRKIKKHREKHLKNVVNQIRIDYNKNWLNKSIPVLPLSKEKGISYYNHDVLFTQPIPKALINTISTGTVIKASTKGLKVKI